MDLVSRKDFKKQVKEAKTVFVYVRLNPHYGDYFKVTKKEVTEILRLNPNQTEFDTNLHEGNLYIG